MSAIPLEWRRHLHGWPGLRDHDLVRLAREVLSGEPWPRRFDGDSGPVVQHPLDPGVLLGGRAGLDRLPVGVDAVVSLCPLGREQMPHPPLREGNHLCVWLIDSEDPAENPNLDLVVEQTVEMLAQLRDEGLTVYLHGAHGRSRTPFIAALYGARVSQVSAAEALREIQRIMPHARPNPLFESLVQRNA